MEEVIEIKLRRPQLKVGDIVVVGIRKPQFDWSQGNHKVKKVLAVHNDMCGFENEILKDSTLIWINNRWLNRVK
jgi:hypothetical protein